MKEIIRRIILSLLAGIMMLCTGCTASAAAGTAAGAGLPGLDALRDRAGLEGVWYEQAPYGAVVTISGNTLHVEQSYPSGDGWSDDVTFRLRSGREYMELVPDDEYFGYIDLWYDASTEQLIFHTLPHTDGDGGYHTILFLKTEYEAPPEPVYGERTDRSDPSAPRTFADHTVRRLTLHVYEPYRDSGDMAQELPVEGEYGYELTAAEDGSARITADFYDGPEGNGVKVSPERMEELAALLEQSGLDAVNGVDIWTEEMPANTEFYELSIEYADGAEYASRANGRDIPVVWLSGAGRELHKFLFDTFIEAGYNWQTGEFHSTEAMKRFGDPSGMPAQYSLSYDREKIETLGKEYSYRVYAEYPVFTLQTAEDGEDGSGSVSGAALRQTLQGIVDHYRQLAEEDLAYDDEVMRTAPASKRNRSGQSVTYSYYSIGRIRCHDSFLSFFVSEGHSNALGLGRYGTGTNNRYVRYCIDAETGEILCAADFFTDPAALTQAVIDALHERYGDGSYYQKRFPAEDHEARLEEALRTPESEGGAGIAEFYDKVTIYLSGDAGPSDGGTVEIELYYDSIQEIMNDRYCSVW